MSLHTDYRSGLTLLRNYAAERLQWGLPEDKLGDLVITLPLYGMKMKD